MAQKVAWTPNQRHERNHQHIQYYTIFVRDFLLIQNKPELVFIAKCLMVRWVRNSVPKIVRKALEVNFLVSLGGWRSRSCIGRSGTRRHARHLNLRSLALNGSEL